MNKFPKYISISIVTFIFGLAAVALWFFVKSDDSKNKMPPVVYLTEPLAEVQVGEKQADEESTNPLDKIWIDAEDFSFQDYKISKKKVGTGWLYNESLEFEKNGKLVARFEVESMTGNWIKYGLFNFLGEDNEQLVVHIYSGGAHCCYDYVIYDLKPDFRIIYDSRKYDSANEIGNELFPVDIDNDGTVEFTRSVMAFDYFYASHADSVFPPVVFAYDKKKGRYNFANKNFSNFVTNELKENLEWLKKNRGATENSESLIEMDNRYIVRKTFLNLIYAGKREEAWKYFADEYSFQDKEEFARDVRKEFSKDVTYQSIYSTRRAD